MHLGQLAERVGWHAGEVTASMAQDLQRVASAGFDSADSAALSAGTGGGSSVAAVVLARACLQGDLATATKALRQGAAVDAVSERHGGSPLYLAAVKGTATGISWHSFLTHCACLAGLFPACPLRVRCSTSRPWWSDADWCVLSDVVSNLWASGHADVVGLLLRRGAAVDRPNVNGITALWAAAQGGHLDAAKRLMDTGAQVNAFVIGINDATVKLSRYCPNVMGMTPLFAAAYSGHYELASAFATCRFPRHCPNRRKM